MPELAWFLMGAFTYKFLSYLLKIAHGVRFLREVQIRSLLLLGSAVEDIAFIKRIKRIAMKTSNLSEEQINTVENNDDEIFEVWKTDSIQRIKKSLPSTLQPTVLADNWSQAMQLLDQIYKEKREQSESE